jgi:molybdopterin-biosynthesis enzyme MoeA-like protein
MIINQEALDMVKEKYRRYESTIGRKIELTPARLKMANLPEGAKPLRNPVGTAPGILIATEKSKIISLPGVPAEMEAIFEDDVKTIIREECGSTFICNRSIRIMNVMESSIAPLIDEVRRENSYVYIKSHPKGLEAHPYIELHLMTRSRSKNTSHKRIKAAIEQISRLILEYGGEIDT